jgi:hypothetical protein
LNDREMPAKGDIAEAGVERKKSITNSTER